MVSGNFLIGQKGLSLDAFTEYIEKPLKEKGYAVQNKLSVNHDDCARSAVLVSIAGQGNFEKIINDLLLKTAKFFEEKSRKDGIPACAALSYQLEEYIQKENISKGVFKVIGIYTGNNTASELFPALAQSYLFETVKAKIDEVSDSIEDIKEKFK